MRDKCGISHWPPLEAETLKPAVEVQPKKRKARKKATK